MWERVKYVLRPDVEKMTPAGTVTYGVFRYVFNVAAGLGILFVATAIFEPGTFIEYLAGDGRIVLWVASIVSGVAAYESYARAREQQATGSEPRKRKWRGRSVAYAAVMCGGGYYGLTLLIEYVGLSAATIGDNVVLALTGGVASTAVYAVLWRLWSSREDRGNHEPNGV